MRLNRSFSPAGHRPRRFTILSTCPEPWGGSEELWWAAACALRSRGYLVDVLKTGVAKDHPRIRHLRAAGCAVRELTPARSPGALYRGSLGLQIALATALLVARRPHLVIISQGQNFDGLHLALVCRALRLQYVLISQKASDTHWPLDGRRAYRAEAFLRAKHSVFVSENNLRLTEEQLAVRLENALLCRNPVLAGRAGPLPWPQAPPGELRLACVARLNVREKGQDVLLRVLAQEQWRRRPVKVRLYGEGQNRAGLMALAQSLHCEQVSFEGTCSDIESVWRAHHALVLSSREEGLPLALVEAMMCGRPAVVTDVGGNGEVIEDGVTGMIASAASVTALDEALERFWARQRDWEAMGTAAAQRIREIVPEEPSAVLVEKLLEAVGATADADGPTW